MEARIAKWDKFIVGDHSCFKDHDMGTDYGKVLGGVLSAGAAGLTHKRQKKTKIKTRST